MLKTVEGIYQDGKIQLTELPSDIVDSSQVLVTFLDAKKLDITKLRQLLEQVETIAGIQQGIEQVNLGQTRSLGDFVQEIQKKYDRRN